jgi:hypothetical protein
MKLIIPFILTIFLFSSCAHDKTINGTLYKSYGLINENTYKDTAVKYQVPFRVIVTTVIFFETIFVPIYNIGYHLYEPVELKSSK